MKSFSQGRAGYLAGTGIMYYNGDINEKSDKIISHNKVFKPFFRGGINYRISKRMEASLAILYGNIAGADSLATEKDNRFRNQSFRSVIEELSLQLEYHLFSVYRKKHLNPFVLAGIGVFHFNPQAQLNGTWYDLQPVGTEGQNLGGNYPKPYSLTQLSFPIGIGIYYQLNDHWRIRLDYTQHMTMTDYLDDVSTNYPDLNALANAPNGALAVALSNRTLSGEPRPGGSRGNPKFKDNFSQIGITVIYNPGMLRIGRSYNKNRFAAMNSKRVRSGKTCVGRW